MKINKNTRKVSAGTLGETVKTVRQVFDTVLKGIDNFLNISGWKSYKEEEVTENIQGEDWSGIRKFYKSGTGDEVAISIFDNPADSKRAAVRIEVKGKPKLKLEKANVAKSTIEKLITKFMDDNGLGSNEGEVNSSKKVKVTLKRVTSGTEDTIHLTAINANYNIVLAMDAVDEVLEDEEFTDQIGEDPVSFEITESEDGEAYNVDEINNEDVDASVAYEELFRTALHIYHDLQAIHWGAKGLRMWELHNYSENLIWTYRSRIDTLAELMVERTGKIPHPSMYCCSQQSDEDSNISERLVEGFTFEEGMKYIRDEVHNWIDALEGYYVNLDRDIQGMVDEWIRSDKHEADYLLDRQLIPLSEEKATQPANY